MLSEIHSVTEMKKAFEINTNTRGYKKQIRKRMGHIKSHKGRQGLSESRTEKSTNACKNFAKQFSGNSAISRMRPN